MFLRDYQNGLLMNANEDGGAGAGAGANNQASGDNTNQPVVEDIAKIKAEFEAIKKNRDEILAEKKKLGEELNSIKSQNSQEAKKRAEEEKNFEALYKITLEEKKGALERLDMIEKAQMAEKEKVVKTQMWNAFTKELGAELHDAAVAEKLVQWDKFVSDEKSKYGFNEDGIKQAVNEFRTKHSYLLKTEQKQMPADSAKSTADDPSKLSFAERAQKAGLFVANKK